MLFSGQGTNELESEANLFLLVILPCIKNSLWTSIWLRMYPVIVVIVDSNIPLLQHTRFELLQRKGMGISGNHANTMSMWAPSIAMQKFSLQGLKQDSLAIAMIHLVRYASQPCKPRWIFADNNTVLPSSALASRPSEARRLSCGKEQSFHLGAYGNTFNGEIFRGCSNRGFLPPTPPRLSRLEA